MDNLTPESFYLETRLRFIGKDKYIEKVRAKDEISPSSPRRPIYIGHGGTLGPRPDPVSISTVPHRWLTPEKLDCRPPQYSRDLASHVTDTALDKEEVVTDAIAKS